MSSTYTAACIQINAGNDIKANLKKAKALIATAAKKGAVFITLPENFALMAASREEFTDHLTLEDEHQAVSAMQAAAKKHAVWLLAGTIAVALPDDVRAANRSLLISPKGEIVARYDKIHMYDVDVQGGERHKESERFKPGNEALIASLPWHKLGMTICYDLRFPYLYRHLAQAGAGIIAVPSAFTKFTGEAHWHTLLRARAIECQSFIIAPAQVGQHPASRATYGHSLIVDPWGGILAEAGGEEEGVIIADIDIDKVDMMRKQIPSLNDAPKYKGI